MSTSTTAGPALVVKQRTLVIIASMMATSLQMVDSTIANVALPHMQSSFAAAQDQISWVLTSYIVAAAIVTPVTGWLTTRFGRKHVFLVSVAGFTAASMMCGWAQTLDEMVIFRVLQGALGATLGPLSQSIMYDLYPPGKQGQSMAIWSVGVMVAPMVAPTLGGWLTDDYSWRWCFFINAPIGAVAFLGLIFLPEDRRHRGHPFDFMGFGLLTVAVGAVQLLLDRGQERDWFNSAEIIIEAGVAISGVWMFAVHSAMAEKPFFSPRLLGDRTFTSGMLIAFVTFSLMFSSTALIPQLLQNLLGYPVMTAGELSMPRGAGSIAGALLVARLMGRFDARAIMLTGIALVSISMWWMLGFSLYMDRSIVIWTGMLQGFGVMLTFIPLNTQLFTSVPIALRTEAMAFFSLVRSVAGSIGISVVTALLARNIQANHSTLAEHANVFNPTLSDPALHGLWSLHSQTGLMALDAEINRQAAMIAYIDDFKMMMIAMLATAPLLLFLKGGRVRQGSKAEAQALAPLE